MQFHFQDARPPHQIQFQLERDLMILLQPVATGRPLVYQGSLKLGGATYALQLLFTDAQERVYYYTLNVETTPDEPQAKSWLAFWTRGFTPAPPPRPDAARGDRYEAAVAQALSAEAHLTSVAEIQDEIIRRLREGGTYATAHKEGGTNISARGSGFVRSDYGESDRTERFASREAFLLFLRQFYDWETSRHSYPEKAPDLVAWRLILRLLRPPER